MALTIALSSVRYAWRVCGIDAVDVERDVQRPVHVRALATRERAHVDHVDAKLLRLESLRAVHRANADLHELPRELLIEDPRERTRV